MDREDIKIGIKVRIKDQIIINKDTDATFYTHMCAHLGKIGVISTYIDGMVGLLGMPHEWHPEWLELVEEDGARGDDTPNIHNIYKE